MFEKLIGLSFASLAADMLLIKSSFKKYVKAVIGVMFVITVISGISAFGDFSIEIPSAEEIEIEENETIFKENLTKEVVINTEKKIKDKFFEENIEITGIVIDFDDNFRIKKIKLSLKNYSNDKDKAIELLVNYFNLNKEVIEVCRG